MAHAMRSAWNAHRHWLAAGFPLSTGLFLLLIILNWRSEQRVIDQQRATGLSATTWDMRSAWSQRTVQPLSKQRARMGADNASSIIGGMTERLRSVRFEPRDASSAEPERLVIRSGTLEIIATDPLQAALQLRNLATHLSRFVVSSKVSGSDERMQSAQVTVRIPADHFEEARSQVRAIAKSVEQDIVEARDVTRESVDQEAALRNARAEEQQYLLILKRAASVKDVLEVSSKLAEVRAHIDELQTDLRSLHSQVEMSLLTTNVTAKAEAQVFGIRWRPLYKAKLSLRGALSSVADYGDSMVDLLVNLPVIAIWGFAILALLKVGWIVLRRIVRLRDHPSIVDCQRESGPGAGLPEGTLLKRISGWATVRAVSVFRWIFVHSPRNRRHAKLALFAVQRGYMFRHGKSRLTTSNIMGSLQLTCVETPLHEPR